MALERVVYREALLPWLLALLEGYEQDLSSTVQFPHEGTSRLHLECLLEQLRHAGLRCLGMLKSKLKLISDESTAKAKRR